MLLINEIKVLSRTCFLVISSSLYMFVRLARVQDLPERAAQRHHEEMRQRQLQRFGEAGDHDLLDGRFGKKIKKRPKDPKEKDGGTSSTRISTRLGQEDHTTLGDEDSIHGLIGKELQIFFAAVADAKLFVKVMVSDGIVS